MNLFKHKKHPSPKGLLLVAGLAWGIVSMSAVSADTIAQTPLFITSSIAPNILFILDNSGSMDLSYLPDSVNDLVIKKEGGNIIIFPNRVKSATINKAYYDPDIVYIPPVDQDGKSLGDSPFTKAWTNGYEGYESSTNHGGATTVDLSTAFQPTWAKLADGESTYIDDFNHPNPDDTPQAAYYYKFSPPRTDCPGLGDINNDACYERITVSATEQQNFANWYSYYRTRLMLARVGISRAFAKLGTTLRVGYGRINKGADATTPIETMDIKGNDTVVRGVRTFSGDDREAFFKWLFNIGGTGSTPLRRALDSAGLYYSNQASGGPWGGTPGIEIGSEELLACRQSYTLLMTDGYWNIGEAKTDGARANNDGTDGVEITGPEGKTFTYKAVSPFKDTFSNTLADVAMYYWKRDLCPDIANKVPSDPAFWQHMVTYGIGLGVPTAINPDKAVAAIKAGTAIAWPDPDATNPSNATVARIDDLLHASVNGRGGFFNANNPKQLTDELNKTLSKIISESTSAASAVAANSTQLITGTQVFQARFDPSEWSGELQAFPVGSLGVLGENGWKASSWLDKDGQHVNRNIYTFNPSAITGSRGVPFEWNSLDTSQQAALNGGGEGMSRVAWLRGDRANEKISDDDTVLNPAHIFRKRTSILGDLINSDPLYVGAEDQGYGAVSSLSTSYNAFLEQKKIRKPMLYVGANDGMLHGFDASNPGGGQEIFAYIPNALFPELGKLTSPDYIHQYYVDGASGVGDVYNGITKDWRTLLVGTTGAGGRAAFGLDVTDPDKFGPDSALWEFTSADDADLGYTLAQPLVVRMQDERWAVIVANGYNSDNGHAVLFVRDALTGVELQKIDTGIGDMANKNGLSSPIAIDTDNNQGVDTIYAGDLYGNLWKFKFDVVNGKWIIPDDKPLFVACATTGTTCLEADRQPITSKPNVGKVGVVGTDQNGEGTMVYFGTGKYFEAGDNMVGTHPQTQTFYGLWDHGTAITDRANLQEQSIDYEGFASVVCKETSCPSSSHPIRLVSKNPVCYTAASATGCSSPFKSGWAIDLLKSDNAGGHVAEGERVVSFPLVRRGLVVFATAIPASEPCKSGGKSWLMEVDALGGGEFSGAPFDVNGDGVVDDKDKVFIVVDGVRVEHYATGVDLEVGLHKAPAKVESSSGVDYGYVSGSTGKMGANAEAGDSGPGVHRSWRQLK